jgi:hypothetical protein
VIEGIHDPLICKSSWQNIAQRLKERGFLLNDAPSASVREWAEIALALLEKGDMQEGKRLLESILSKIDDLEGAARIRACIPAVRALSVAGEQHRAVQLAYSTMQVARLHQPEDFFDLLNALLEPLSTAETAEELRGLWETIKDLEPWWPPQSSA